MSHEIEPYFAYGIAVGPTELRAHYGGQYDESGVPEEWAESLAKEHGLKCTIAGNAWTGVELFIIGPEVVIDDGGATVVVALEGIDATRALSRKLEPCPPLRWHLGVWEY